VILLLVYVGFSWAAILRLRRRVPAKWENESKWPWLGVPNVLLRGKTAEAYAREFPQGRNLEITRRFRPAIGRGLVVVLCLDLINRILR
jgi:hypothetical protein